jgi:hypothetical protein
MNKVWKVDDSYLQEVELKEKIRDIFSQCKTLNCCFHFVTFNYMHLDNNIINSKISKIVKIVSAGAEW